MEQRTIGSLSVSVVGMGCNQLGTKACDETVSLQVVGEALDNGITLFDTSDEYGRDYANPADLSGWGRSEELLGQALAGRRDEAVIATKFGPVGPVRDGTDPLVAAERSQASAAGIRIAVEESLRRLGTDRIDLYQLHFPDPRYPIAETLSALDELVQAGKVLEIGSANFDAAMLREAADAAEELGVRPFASSQNLLNLLQRKALDDSLAASAELGLAFLPYYPLASGVLTGKYKRGEASPAGARLTDQVTEDVRAKMLSERTFDRLDALTAFAAERGHTLLELAFVWLLGHGPVASVIAGASKPGQPASNAAAGDWHLEPDEVEAVTTIIAGV